MYEVALTEAYFPAQRDSDVREITVGGLLREIAARRPNAEALVEELPSPQHRGAHFVVPIPGKGGRGKALPVSACNAVSLPASDPAALFRNAHSSSR